MLAGTLEIEMMANIARLQKDMDEARRVVGSAMSGVKDSVAIAQGALIGLGAVGLVGAFTASVKASIDYADKLDELSQKAGITTESLSQLQYAAKMGGAETETFNTAMKKLNQSIAGGLAGDKEKVAWFKQLGVTFADAQGKARGADAVLLDLADTFEKSSNGAGKASAAVALMGKAGDEMIPLLNGGAQSIRDLMTEGDKLGLTISGEYAKQAGDFNDSLDRLRLAGDKLAITMGGTVVSSLGDIARKMADATIEGGKLKGVMAGIDAIGNQLFDWEGNAQRKMIANLKKDIGDLAGEKSALTVDLFGRGPDIEKEMADKLARLGTLQAQYFKLTDGSTGGGRGRVNPPLIPLNELNGTGEIKPPSSGGAGARESEYEKLVKRVNERIAASTEALRVGRELTAAEAFEVKTLQDMDEVKGKLSATERTHLTALLDTAKVQAGLERDMKVSVDENTRFYEGLTRTTASLRDQAKAQEEVTLRVGLTTAELQRLDAAKAEGLAQDALVRASVMDVIDLSGRTGDVYREQAVLIRQVAAGKKEAFAGGIESATKSALDQIEDEIRLLKLSNAEREVAIRLRATEALGLEKGSAAHEKFAADLRGGLGRKGEAEEGMRAQVAMWEGIDSAARDAFLNMDRNGTKVFAKLTDSLRSGLYSVLYDMTVKQWIVQIRAQVEGPGTGGGQALGGLGSALSGLLGSVGSGISSLFGASGLGSATAEMVAAAGPGLMFFADGGDPPLGRASIVGERGPELFVPKQAGTIVPNHKLVGVGGASMTFATTINIDSRTDQAQQHAALQMALDQRDRAWHENLQKQGVLA